MTIREKIKGWKTTLWNGLVGLSGVALLLVDQLQYVDWTKVFTPTTVGLILFGLSIAGIILRVFTTSAIGKKC